MPDSRQHHGVKPTSQNRRYLLISLVSLVVVAGAAAAIYMRIPAKVDGTLAVPQVESERPIKMTVYLLSRTVPAQAVIAALNSTKDDWQKVGERYPGFANESTVADRCRSIDEKISKITGAVDLKQTREILSCHPFDFPYFSTIVRAAKLEVIHPSADGKFAFEKIEPGDYYLYSLNLAEDGFSEYLVAVSLGRGGNVVQLGAANQTRVVTALATQSVTEDPDDRQAAKARNDKAFLHAALMTSVRRQRAMMN